MLSTKEASSCCCCMNGEKESIEAREVHQVKDDGKEKTTQAGKSNQEKGKFTTKREERRRINRNCRWEGHHARRNSRKGREVRRKTRWTGGGGGRMKSQRAKDGVKGLSTSRKLRRRENALAN